MLRNIPISAIIGLVITSLFLFLFTAAAAPWIAPYGLGETVGGVWEPASATY